MLHFLAEYGLFLAKTATIIIGLIILIAFIFGAATKGKSPKQKLRISNLNKRYKDYEKALSTEIFDKNKIKLHLKNEKQAAKKTRKSKDERSRVFVINFNGDIRASAVAYLREEITAILTIAKPSDEVVVKVESPGGIVAGYGLAASQLMRFREQHIPLTICVDKVAASGGYMMAAVGNQILAAPYAIIGSIGVVAQLPNFHRLLKRNNIDFEQITAGEYKRTLSMFGENTEKGREKVQEDVNNVHQIFKQFITENRPSVTIDQVATGEHWHGVQALQLKLVDKLQTSDDYLMQASQTKDIFEVTYEVKKTLSEKLFHSAKQAQNTMLDFSTSNQVTY